jgi:hypothetical protein
MKIKKNVRTQQKSKNNRKYVSKQHGTGGRKNEWKEVGERNNGKRKVNGRKQEKKEKYYFIIVHEDHTWIEHEAEVLQ